MSLVWVEFFFSDKELEQACKEAVHIYNTERPHLALYYNVPNEVYESHIVDN